MGHAIYRTFIFLYHVRHISLGKHTIFESYHIVCTTQVTPISCHINLISPLHSCYKLLHLYHAYHTHITPITRYITFISHHTITPYHAYHTYITTASYQITLISHYIHITPYRAHISHITTYHPISPHITSISHHSISRPYNIYLEKISAILGQITFISPDIYMRLCQVFIRHITPISHPYHAISPISYTITFLCHFVFIPHNFMFTPCTSHPYGTSHISRDVTLILHHSQITSYSISHLHHATSYLYEVHIMFQHSVANLLRSRPPQKKKKKKLSW